MREKKPIFAMCKIGSVLFAGKNLITIKQNLTAQFNGIVKYLQCRSLLCCISVFTPSNPVQNCQIANDKVLFHIEF